MSWAKQPIDGFRVFHLGCIAYRAVASSEFIERYFKNGVTIEAAGASPSLRYNNQDGSTVQWLEQVWGTTAKTLSTRLPYRNAILDSCLFGSAWAVLPEHDVLPHLEDGKLVELIPETPLQKDLYWHISSTMAEPIAGLTSSVRKAARAHLLAVNWRLKLSMHLRLKVIHFLLQESRIRGAFLQLQRIRPFRYG